MDDVMVRFESIKPSERNQRGFHVFRMSQGSINEQVLTSKTCSSTNNEALNLIS